MNEATKILLNKEKTKHIHTQILKTLIEEPATYFQIRNEARKEDDTLYSDSYVRRSLRELQQSQVVGKKIITNYLTVYYINSWEVFNVEWNRRRKQVKRKVFNKANTEIPDKEHLIVERRKARKVLERNEKSENGVE